VREVSTVAGRNGVQVGTFYWGAGAAGSDAQWMDWARLHIREVEAAGIGFDFLRFVSRLGKQLHRVAPGLRGSRRRATRLRALRHAMARTTAGAALQIGGAAACGRGPRRRDLQRVRCGQVRRGMDTTRRGPLDTLERDASLVPDDAIIQTWDRHPARFLPETQPGTLTYLVNRYGSRH
jgi:hypothetical protein